MDWGHYTINTARKILGAPVKNERHSVKFLVKNEWQPIPGYAILMDMTRFIRRTITITVIETLTLIWVNPNHDECARPNDAAAANLATQSDFVACSVSRVTTSVNSTLLPACTGDNLQ